MTEKQNSSYKVTATLLNSWLYLFKVDKQYYDKAYKDFISYLNREKIEPNYFMIRGIQFEKKCVDGKVPFISETIEGGAYQVFAKKTIDLEGFGLVTVLGYLDCLKNGIIYDIKRVSKFDLQKYYKSSQHHIYMFLIPEATEFIYLIAQGARDDRLNIYQEKYTRDDYIPVEKFISDFYKWLRSNDLFEIYKEHWTIENKKESYL